MRIPGPALPTKGVAAVGTGAESGLCHGVKREAWSVGREAWCRYHPPFGFTGHRSLPVTTILSPLATRHYSLRSCDRQATGRDCSLNTTSVNRRDPPSMPRAELVTALPSRTGSTCYEMLRFTIPTEVLGA